MKIKGAINNISVSLKSVAGVALLVGVLASHSARATELGCYPEARSAKAIAPLKDCSLDVSIDVEKSQAVGKWNGQRVVTTLQKDNDNMAEFEFAPEATGGIWQHENADGSKVWVGFVLPTQDSGFCRVKCTELKK